MNSNVPKTHKIDGKFLGANCKVSDDDIKSAVFEMFKMNHEIENLILHDPNESEIFKVARKHGLITMKEDAIIKAMNKVIPFGEINDL